jgi:hypothetical protein
VVCMCLGKGVGVTCKEGTEEAGAGGGLVSIVWRGAIGYLHLCSMGGACVVCKDKE